jgi:predicted lipoprotein with Yx(FWY)xxD motif
MKTTDVPRSRTKRARILTILGGLAALGIVVAACGGAKHAVGYGTSSSSSQDRTVAMQPSKSTATVGLAMNAAIGQRVLVDSNGMTLYFFVPDGTGTRTTVPAQFKPNWPQLTAAGAPSAGPGVDMTKLAVHAQSDSTEQVSYHGHLLYTFINDKVPGDANGQGLGPRNWFVLDSNGNPIGAPHGGW